MTNKFKKAELEVGNKKAETKKTNKFTNPININSTVPKQKKERKEQMSIVLTPTHKKKLRILADNSGMSASELIGYWIDLN